MVFALTDSENNGDTLLLTLHDLACAFDSSVHKHILHAAAERGVEHSIIEPFDSVYSNLRVKIKYPNRDCNILMEIDIPVKRGIRQG